MTNEEPCDAELAYGHPSSVGAYPSLLEHIRAYAGTRNWCVAHRVSRRTAAYDVVITPKEYAREQAIWASNHPAWLLANTLPAGEAKNFILKAVQA